jgi:hypothetical protein
MLVVCFIVFSMWELTQVITSVVRPVGNGGRRTVDFKKGLCLSFHIGLSASRQLKLIHLAINPLKHGGFCTGVPFAFQLQRMLRGVMLFLPKISFRNFTKMQPY